MRLIGQLEHGFYIENDLTIHPEVLSHYYGSRTSQVEPQTVTGSNEQDGNDNEWEDVGNDDEVTSDLASCIADEQASQFLQKAANVPKQTNPFNNQDYKLCFRRL